ncbi:lipase [Rhodococcus sp. WB9]|uniref:lipase family protein n=1 Tax=Rhodococcus sp. WB9 TaxID=2594007 RepID=UPI00118726D9|nr:lipase family protein [Rhodococcus sp. WB9]QDQ93364.1 lipase [Rhodococcus sp. WB9]
MTSSLGRRTGTVLAAALALSLLGAPTPAAAQTAGGDPGAVVVATPVAPDARPPGVADAAYVTYWTTGPLNEPALSTGAVLLPPGEAPPGGWPVVSWAHGTVGIADKCAPTVTGKLVGPYVQHWLDQGYAVVATDYVGLGTPGVHPYLDGPTEAHSVIDMVRAARTVTPSLSNRWVAIGQSQGGHAALVAASMATTYASDLDFRGTVATGAPSNLENLAPLVGPGFPQLPLTGSTVFVAYALAGLRASRPDLEIDSYLTPLGVDVLNRVESLCYEEAAPQLDGISIGQLMARPLDDPAVLAALRITLGVPVRGYDRPLFIGQGLFDDVVPIPLTWKLTADLTANGQQFVFRTYPTGHLYTMPASLPDTSAFVRSLFGT